MPKTEEPRLTLASIPSPYGAQLGRSNLLPEDPQAPIQLRLAKLRWVDGDYDAGGVYWGGGRDSKNMYCGWCNAPEVVRVYVRGNTAPEAREAVREQCPQVEFVGITEFDVGHDELFVEEDAFCSADLTA